MNVLKRCSLFFASWMLAACGYDNRQSGVDPMSDTTRMSDDLYNFILWIDVAMAVGVTIVLFMPCGSSATEVRRSARNKSMAPVR